MNDNNRLFPNKVMFGHAYVPNQTLVNVFSKQDALKHGTLFPELVSPYMPGQSMEVIDLLRMDGGDHR